MHHRFLNLVSLAAVAALGACDKTPSTPVAGADSAPPAVLNASDTSPVTESVQDPDEREIPRANVTAYQTARSRADFAMSELLPTIVSDAGLVHYERFQYKKHKTLLALAVKEYGQAEMGDDPKDQIAVWCNAYNANVLFYAMLEFGKPGFQSVLDVPGFFDSRPMVVARETVTLNELENERLRPLGDPRIHAALVCAAMSCPVLRQDIYVPDRLDEQLDAQCRRWINDPAKNRVEGGALHLSEIFKWYEDDFKVEPYGGVLGFVKAFAEPGGELAAFLDTNPQPRIEWIEYDWKLNLAR